MKQKEKWQLDRVERAIHKARADESSRQACFWPCVHLASAIAGSDMKLIWCIAVNRLRISVENFVVSIYGGLERFYFRFIKGFSRAEYEAHLDREFETFWSDIFNKRGSVPPEGR